MKWHCVLPCCMLLAMAGSPVDGQRTWDDVLRQIGPVPGGVEAILTPSLGECEASFAFPDSVAVITRMGREALGLYGWYRAGGRWGPIPGPRVADTLRAAVAGVRCGTGGIFGKPDELEQLLLDAQGIVFGIAAESVRPLGPHRGFYNVFYIRGGGLPQDGALKRAESEGAIHFDFAPYDSIADHNVSEDSSRFDLQGWKDSVAAAAQARSDSIAAVVRPRSAKPDVVPPKPTTARRQVVLTGCDFELSTAAMVEVAVRQINLWQSADGTLGDRIVGTARGIDPSETPGSPAWCVGEVVSVLERRTDSHGRLRVRVRTSSGLEGWVTSFFLLE